MAKSKDLEKRRLITPEFRVSYPSIFEKSAYEDGTPEYSLTALFPKNVDLKPLKKAALAAAIEKFGEEFKSWPEKKKSRFRWPWRDGDKEKSDSPEYEGMYFVKFSAKKNKPGLVDKKTKPILDEEDFYAGCYARAEIVAYAYEKAGNLGVSFDLWNVQKLRDGEPFSGRRDPSEVFDALEDDDELEDESDDELLDEDEPEEKPKKKASQKPSAKPETKKAPAKRKPEPEDDEADDDDNDFGFD